MFTTDGGAHLEWSSVPWSVAQTNQKDALVSVACNAMTCVTVSRGNGTSTAQSRVYRSTDGGSKWDSEGILPKATGMTQAAKAVACDQGNNCVIVGPSGGVWRSTDGGVTWLPLATPSALPYFTVQCPGPDSCIAGAIGKTGATIVKGTVTNFTLPTTGTVTALGCGSTKACLATDNLRNVFTSDDLGKKWNNLGKTLPEKSEASALTCVSDTTCVGLTQTARVLRTTDGGLKWKIYLTDTPGKVPPQAISCASSICAVVGNKALFARSTDGGVLWNTLNFVPDMSALTCLPATNTGRTCLSGAMDDIGKSTDAGMFWHLPIEHSTSLDLKAVSCAGAPKCLAIGKPVLKSPDSGDTWSFTTPVGAGPPGPEGATCVTGTFCVAVGAGGSVFTTLDGANSWSLSTAPGGPILSAVSCPDTKLCFAAANNGAVYRGVRTIDPTDPTKVAWSFHGEVTGVDSPLKAIDCPTSTVCVMVGDSGVTLHTTDSGATWSKVVTGGGQGVWASVHCPSSTFCVTAGVGGGDDTGHMTVGITDDTGQTWTRQVLGEGTLHAVYCTSPTQCLAGGSTVLVGHP